MYQSIESNTYEAMLACEGIIVEGTGSNIVRVTKVYMFYR